MRFWCTSHKDMVATTNCDHYQKVKSIISCVKWICFEHEDNYELNNQQEENGRLVAPSSIYLNCLLGITDWLIYRLEEIMDDDITPSLMTRWRRLITLLLLDELWAIGYGWNAGWVDRNNTRKCSPLGWASTHDPTTKSVVWRKTQVLVIWVLIQGRGTEFDFICQLWGFLKLGRQ